MQGLRVTVSLHDEFFRGLFRKMAIELRKVELFWSKMLKESCFQGRNHRSGMDRLFSSHSRADM